MAKPNWNKELREVLKHETKEMTFVSERTGKEYQAEAVPILKVVSNGNVEKVENETGISYRYSVVDTKNSLEYAIKVAKKIDVSFGTGLAFKNVRGGATSQGGWYGADSVALIDKNA